MELLTEQQQIDVIRNKCDNAKRRIWIASPYIGKLKDVQKIIGGKWLLPSVDCRILTDVDFGFIRKDTFDEFIGNQVKIKSLNSLHAKIYLVDDWCLVTSANLTGTAFFCRYEMGFASNITEEVERTFLRWWEKAIEVKVLTKEPPKGIIDYQDGKTFKKKFKALKYVSGEQDKYEALCEKYFEFAHLYESITGRNHKMVKDGFTLLQEVDYFFNFLYHDHPKTPSHGQETPRSISDEQRNKEIKKYFTEMCNYYTHEPQSWRLDRTKIVRNNLKKDKIHNLDWNQVEEVVDCLHCLQSYAFQKKKFLRPQNNKLKDIKDCWFQLLHTGKVDYVKINMVNKRLKFFGPSSIYELIGWFNPDKYPLMNKNSDCGMRFFGYPI